MFRMFSPLVHFIEAMSDASAFDAATMTALLRPTGGGIPHHRSPGGRAHRRWRKTRSAGRR